MNNNTEVIAPFAQPEQLYAAVDLGSNSFHMVIVRVVAGSVYIIGKVKQKVRLAAGLDENMVLDQQSLEDPEVSSGQPGSRDVRAQPAIRLAAKWRY